MRHLPWLLVGGRALLAPALIILLEAGALGDRLVLAIYLVAFATDYFDGAIARKLGVATPALRHADSAADTVFHVALGWVTWRLHPEEVRASAAAFLAFLATSAVWYLLDAFRWKKLAGFHAWSAKSFSVAIMVWAVALYSGLGAGPLLSVAFAIGTLANVEGVAISLTLRRHSSDVPTILHALELRRSAGAT
ncbi:CDP-alcohol phosphatidyltransferase family protein [bacterium]|nr:CDP-alcohol phosphatidyltransferase family protein [bacterium]